MEVGLRLCKRICQEQSSAYWYERFCGRVTGEIGREKERKLTLSGARYFSLLMGVVLI